MAEAIETTCDGPSSTNPVNPKYYEKMSVLLDELIELRRSQAISYQEYLEEKVRELAMKVKRPASGGQKPILEVSIPQPSARYMTIWAVMKCW